MTDEEMTATVRDLKSGMDMLAQEWGDFLKFEASRREEDAVVRRKKESSDSQKAAAEVADWERKQTFLAKHGVKLATVMFSIVTAGLAWYGSQIRSEIQAEERAKQVDESIETNAQSFSTFKDETFNDFKTDTDTDIKTLQRESVNQTLMIDEGFKRVDQIMIKATRLREEDLPDRPPEFDQAVKDAKALKTHNDKFGQKEK